MATSLVVRIDGTWNAPGQTDLDPVTDNEAYTETSVARAGKALTGKELGSRPYGSIASVLLALLIFSLPFVRPNYLAAEDTIAGTWACQSISSGAYTGRPCRLEPWLKLEAGASYAWGQETGKWAFTHKLLTLSKRKGQGHLDAEGKLIYEYEMNGKQYVMTLYKRKQ